MPRKITKRGPGKYLLTISVGYNAKGKQVIRSKIVMASSDLEARRAYAKFETDVLGSQKLYANSNCRLEDFADIWLRDYCDKYLSPSTALSYRNQLKLRINPELGHKRLNKIMPMDIIRFVNHLQDTRHRFDGKDKPLSDEVISYTFHVLTSMLHDAVEWQMIDFNPCDNVPRPKVRHRKVILPTEKEVDKILEALTKVPLKFRTLVFLAIATGLRRGEILGLQWSDIDLDKGLLRVERTVQVIDKQPVIKGPKTNGSQRTIVLPASIIKLLKEYKTEQRKRKKKLLNQWLDQGWIFTTWNGRYMSPSTPSKWFHDFLVDHKLAHMSFHALRHLSATILISEGVPLKNVSSRLGHADIRTTANIYSDALQSVDRAASNMMEQYLSKQNNDPEDQ
jgi:integrase